MKTSLGGYRPPPKGAPPERSKRGNERGSLTVTLREPLYPFRGIEEVYITPSVRVEASPLMVSIEVADAVAVTVVVSRLSSYDSVGWRVEEATLAVMKPRNAKWWFMTHLKVRIDL